MRDSTPVVDEFYPTEQILGSSSELNSVAMYCHSSEVSTGNQGTEDGPKMWLPVGLFLEEQALTCHLHAESENEIPGFGDVGSLRRDVTDNHTTLGFRNVRVAETRD